MGKKPQQVNIIKMKRTLRFVSQSFAYLMKKEEDAITDMRTCDEMV